MEITRRITAEEFIALSKACGWGVKRDYDLQLVKEALSLTTNFVVRGDRDEVIGCGRVLSDGMFVSTIPDLFVHPDHQKQGIGREIMEAIKYEFANTSIYFGAQPEVEGFYEKLGFERGLALFQGRFQRSE
jgi:GNAT superfamily N-acetyltransferase